MQRRNVLRLDRRVTLTFHSTNTRLRLRNIQVESKESNESNPKRVTNRVLASHRTTVRFMSCRLKGDISRGLSQSPGTHRFRGPPCPGHNGDEQNLGTAVPWPYCITESGDRRARAGLDTLASTRLKAERSGITSAGHS